MAQVIKGWEGFWEVLGSSPNVTQKEMFIYQKQGGEDCSRFSPLQLATII